MTRRITTAEAMSRKAAAFVAAQDDEDETASTAVPETPDLVDSASPSGPEPTLTKRAGGRPRGRRPVAARQTVYLDEDRHAALSRLADGRGRSIHSLILEGIDAVIGKPAPTGWQ